MKTKAKRPTLSRDQVMEIANVYRALGVLERSLHVLPAAAQSPMRQVLKAVSEHHGRKPLDVVERIGVLAERREVQR